MRRRPLPGGKGWHVDRHGGDEFDDPHLGRKLYGAELQRDLGWSGGTVITDPPITSGGSSVATSPATADLFRRYRRHHFEAEFETFAERHTGAVSRAWNTDGASMMTAPTGGHLASPKVSRKWGISQLATTTRVHRPKPSGG